ncbi:hypothetical protein [Burkholderia ambifaria]|uniref:hypothetical protein n=1 Tax=Burkholderia ambifaria TaxID=152480 RepID=UPI00158A50DF|nr:hypothetical protein [Burkholderia ambifaria]
MSFILDLLQKIDDLFVSPHLPLDAEYSYAARSAEADRMRRANFAPIVVYRR